VAHYRVREGNKSGKNHAADCKIEVLDHSVYIEFWGMLRFLLLATLLPLCSAGAACCMKAGAMMIDPTATAPAFWSEEDDGVWEPPMVRVLTVRGWPRMKWELETLAVDSAPWLLVGLVFGALLERATRSRSKSIASFLEAKAERSDFALSLRGALVGILVPVCSCGALPLAAAMVKAGASETATIAMIFVSSGSGLDSVFFTAGVLGWRAAAARISSVALVGVVVTLAASALRSAVAAGRSSSSSSDEPAAASGGACCDDVDTHAPAAAAGACCDATDADGCGAPPTGDGGEHDAGDTIAASVLRSTTDGAASVVPFVALGAVATAARAAFLDKAWSVDGGSLFGRSAVLAASLPVQMCEHAIVNTVRGARDLGEIGSGTAFALLVLGPATGIGFFGFVARYRGARAAVAAVAASLVAALGLAAVIDAIEVALGGAIELTGPTVRGEGASPMGGAIDFPKWFSTFSFVTLVLMLATATARRCCITNKAKQA
jgi:uncharacterized membrane protein YraQ (UPF0718 family)